MTRNSMNKVKLQAILENLGAESIHKKGRLLYVVRDGHSAYATHITQDKITNHDMATAGKAAIYSIQSYEDAKGFINSIAERG